MSAQACDFPIGAKLDARVLWALAQMRAQEPSVETQVPTLTFYLLREQGMTDFMNERYYAQLVERSCDRLRKAGLIENRDGGLGPQLTPMAPL